MFAKADEYPNKTIITRLKKLIFNQILIQNLCH